MATHSSLRDWKIPWTEEPDRLASVDCKELNIGGQLSLCAQERLRSFPCKGVYILTKKETQANRERGWRAELTANRERNQMAYKKPVKGKRRVLPAGSANILKGLSHPGLVTVWGGDHVNCCRLLGKQSDSSS